MYKQCHHPLAAKHGKISKKHCFTLCIAHYESAFLRCREFCIRYRQTFGRPSLKHLFKTMDTIHPWIQKYQAPLWPRGLAWSPRIDTEVDTNVSVRYAHVDTEVDTNVSVRVAPCITPDASDVTPPR